MTLNDPFHKQNHGGHLTEKSSYEGTPRSKVAEALEEDWDLTGTAAGEPKALSTPAGEAITSSSEPPNHAQPVADYDALILQIKTLRRELAHERKARAEEQRRFAQDIRFVEKRIKGHLSYRLGKEIVAAGLSPLAWLGLPLKLLRTYRNFRRGQEARSQPRVKAAPARLVDLYNREGPSGITRHLTRLNRHSQPAALARELLSVGRALAAAGVEGAELALSAEAATLNPSPATLRARFWACHRARDFDAANEVAEQISSIAQREELPPGERERLEKILLHPVRQLSILKLIEPPSEPRIPLHPGRLCYVLHNSLPYSSGGYATRSHGLACALQRAGWEVIAITRPGFPFDVTSELTMTEVAREEEIDGINYFRLFEPSRRDFAPVQYIELTASILESELRRQRPEVVVAASNHLTGLPTLIAARRLGIPFFYEVRGLWEITRLSREPEFAKHIAFWIQRSLETAVAKNAEGAFTLTEAMREELEARGVPPESITLLPNCCDPQQFSPRPRDRELQMQLAIPEEVPVIGYVGTFVGYEGLDDLAQACGFLKERGVDFRLLLVGNEDASSSSERGDITQRIEEYARRAGFLDWLTMPGRVPHEMVPRYYSLIDVTPFPRKPLPVCEMVSPIKPLEALAMEKAVLVSDVRALAEMVRDGETGLHFRKGEVQDLAEKLECLLRDKPLRERLGRQGRTWVEEERSWSAIAQRMRTAIRTSID